MILAFIWCSNGVNFICFIFDKASHCVNGKDIAQLKWQLSGENKNYFHTILTSVFS